MNCGTFWNKMHVENTTGSIIKEAVKMPLEMIHKCIGRWPEH